MKGLEFPIISTKVKGLNTKFNIESPSGRKKYFKAKVGDEIRYINRFLKKNTFIAYWLGKKNSGKGTYSKIITEIFGEDTIIHISIGDIVRNVHKSVESAKGKKEIINYLQTDYRGYVDPEEGIKAILNRSQVKVSIPTELMLSLIKREISKYEGKVLFIDGFPRTLDQVSYSLFFRDIINYRQDPDVFVLIDIPESVIAERMKYRVVCPMCQTSRNPKLLITSKIVYDTKTKEFYLVCDNPNCKGSKMVRKEGDDAGLESVRERLDKDENLIRTAFKLYGVPKILLRNHIPVSKSNEYDTYELTPRYSFEWDSQNKRVKVIEDPWIVQDDNGVDSHSLLAPAVVIQFIKQLAEVLNP